MNSKAWIAIAIAVSLHATAGSANAGSFLPAGTFIEGGGSVQLHGSPGGTGTTYCTFGNSDGTRCDISFIANAGSSHGIATAYVDQSGAHVYALPVLSATMPARLMPPRFSVIRQRTSSPTRPWSSRGSSICTHYWTR